MLWWQCREFSTCVLVKTTAAGAGAHWARSRRRRGRRRACRALGAGTRGWRADGLAGRVGAGRGRRRAHAAEARRRWGGRHGGARQAQAGAPGAAAWACSWARLGVLVHLTQFLAWFDSIFFLSH